MQLRPGLSRRVRPYLLLALPIGAVAWATIELRRDATLVARARENVVMHPETFAVSVAVVHDPEDDLVIGRVTPAPVSSRDAFEAGPALWQSEHAGTHVFRWIGAYPMAESETTFAREADLLIVIGCQHVQHNRATFEVEKATGLVRMRERQIGVLPSICEEESIFARIKRVLFR